MNYSRFGAIREVESEQAIAPVDELSSAPRSSSDRALSVVSVKHHLDTVAVAYLVDL